MSDSNGKVADLGLKKIVKCQVCQVNTSTYWYEVVTPKDFESRTICVCDACIAEAFYNFYADNMTSIDRKEFGYYLIEKMFDVISNNSPFNP